VPMGGSKCNESMSAEMGSISIVEGKADMSAHGAKFVLSIGLTSDLGRCAVLEPLDGFARTPAHLGGGRSPWPLPSVQCCHQPQGTTHDLFDNRPFFGPECH
jgi:hypothetical protein